MNLTLPLIFFAAAVGGSIGGFIMWWAIDGHYDRRESAETIAAYNAHAARPTGSGDTP